MQSASLAEGAGHRVGAVDVDASCVRPLDPTVHDMIDLIERYDEVGGLGPVDGPGLPLDQIRLLAPIFPRRNIFCVGKNYREHAKEFAESGYEAGAVKGAEIDQYP